MQRPQLLETRRIAKCYLNYISNHRDQVQPLFELLTVVNHKTRCDYTFVKDFYVDVVADQYTISEKKQVRDITLSLKNVDIVSALPKACLPPSYNTFVLEVKPPNAGKQLKASLLLLLLACVPASSMFL